MSDAKTLTGYSDPEDVFAFSNADAEVVLANISDYGNATLAEQNVKNLVYSWRPDAIWTNGDNTYSTIYAYADTIGGYYGEFVDRNLLWPCPGNHDWDDDTLAAYLAYFDGVVAKRYYYKKVFGPVAIYFLDSNPETPDGNTTSSRQYEWLVDALETSQSPWNLVAFHHTPWGSCSARANDEWMRWGFGDLGADIAFNGHCHVYERVLKDCYHITNGCGGSGLYGFGTPIEGSQVRADDWNGAGKLVATPTKLTWQFHTYDGALVDRLVLEQ
jgi:tartrate-resistant acid phosphatase type 5